MTLNEAIQRENKIAEANQKIVDTEIVFDDVYLSQLYCDDTEVIEEHLSNYRKCAEYHKQLAEWLELLKWYQQGMEDIPSESGVLAKDVYHAGYNKAIDDFKSRLEERILAGKMIDEKFAYIDNCDIDEIAEHLKAGGENDNLRR